MRRVLVTLACAAALLLTSTGVHANPRNEPVIPVGDAGNAELVEEVFEDDLVEDGETEAARLALEYLYATGFHPLANQLRGVSESLYRGKWYVERHDQRRKCIAKRESNGNYEAVSSRGLYRGAYQMSRALAIGATWQMQPEVRREMGDEGLKMVQALREIPPNRWNRYWQDRAFWTIWSKGKGQRHWHGGARSC
jgi:hypothetical protein